ncbi:MAG: hypothetical protein NAOJABEB_02419 [Steroidobacteraceae bacterium]|nr:hypothetical protein [Steroidobacteraceae bacterium]
MLYPFKLDLTRGRVLRIEMDEAALRAASFLDDRILTPSTRGGWVPLAGFEATVPAGPNCPLHFIFHTGHVGSTLVSRLLDATGRVLPLREPLPLRTLAVATGDARFEGLVALFIRHWRSVPVATDAVIVKATSSAARIAPALLDAAPEARAIYLNVRAEPYLATLLAGENSWIDLRGHAPERLQRLAAHGGAPPLPLESLSPGELVAASWLAETTTQRAVLARYPGRVMAVDFDTFLADPAGHLRPILAHFGLRSDTTTVATALASPVLTRYSKAPEHPYDPALRAAVLDEARREHGTEITKGLRLLERLGAGA